MLPLSEMRAFIINKTANNGRLFGDRLPVSTQNGRYSFAEDGFWVGGFWTGLNWLCFEMSGDRAFAEVARASRHRFIKRLYEHPETLDHDTGFLYQLSFIADYKLTGNVDARKIALDSAKALRARFNPKGKFIQAWNVWKPGQAFSEENRGRIIIDCMYNLPLLFWAAEQTGDDAFRETAVAHADTCAATMIRPDYTTYHTYVFEPDTGEPKYGRTAQGYDHESCWTRGQSWAIGGYAYAYRYTGNRRYLDIALGTAKAFMERVEEDGIPMWDFSIPSKEGEPRDSSAATIAVAGILELASHLGEGEDRSRLERYAERTLASLWNHYSSRELPEEQGLILHACGSRKMGGDLDCSFPFADYYFAESVARLSGMTRAYW
ncbi:glycoside hydrolase family 88 protein [Paenibacillus sp.]|uniref:glycoside hydrolase family 88 protein n=1 Tax=Paenibacillus sp. TaxID=58172 RepID=UPI002811B432|nr:glycoside hydrolase family 88 protein [Paenibacillus sp.]